jgi:hypothetical protein
MSYINYAHRADIYTKSTSTSPAGQKKASWSSETTGVKCAFIPAVSDKRNRVVGNRYASDQILQFFFPSNIDIDFDKRIYNIKDIYGNTIEVGPIEITSIVKAPALNGQIHHIEVAGYKVVDE